MEVTREDFEKNDGQMLKDIIQAIKEAQFVAIDLEFSGVPRQANKPVGRKPNVAERYQLLKEGAERYQVLQLGICIVHFDAPTRTYVCRPYTLPVCPTTDSKWNMEREYTFQASAIKFLSDNNFNFNLLFRHGVPYLSHDEEKIVRAREKIALEGLMEDIHVEESQKAFLKEVVNELQAWIDDPNPEYDFVNITGPGNEINGYQKRLVHQVVRSKFPNLVSLSRNKFIQVIKKDENQEKLHLKEKKERSDEKIKRGIGLRYVIDAIRESKVPVVGHNLFGDLVHLYRTFVGKLPGSVEEFAAAIHGDFPVICDTKYIATCEGGITGMASSLQTLNDTLSALTYPSISLHIEHQLGSSTHHNAGFDSFNTAKVLLKLMTLYQCHLNQAGSGAIAEQVARTSMVEFLNRMGRINPEQFLHQDILLPPFDSHLWGGLKNHLRVNGTVENVVILEDEGGVKLESIP
ncbi:CAF1 family ribonuclease-domain-containing protein [Sphaerosporella brunnea]|uniref:CAF1 family ribonuclease-domain-containing protein n=1 Tax=Sphaerosporella brunnea TaxID=1250544 RepID=A0A5J5EY55_9PEZI|nr:CAF1 family ribonuclease-domain-containing protein [Sphaerosporella brunnea]